jgi:hypothetical protein
MPFSNRTKKVQVAQLWEVRWTSLRGSFSKSPEYTHDRPEMEAFTSEAEARDFADALRDAVALLRHEINYGIHIVKGKSA